MVSPWDKLLRDLQESSPSKEPEPIPESSPQEGVGSASGSDGSPEVKRKPRRKRST